MYVSSMSFLNLFLRNTLVRFIFDLYPRSEKGLYKNI